MSLYAFNWFALPPVITAVSCLAVGLLVLRREWTSQVGRALLLLMVTIAVWLTAIAVGYLSTDPVTALGWARISYFAIPLLPTAAFFYITAGIRLYQPDRALLWGSVLASVGFIVLAQAGDLLLRGVEEHWWGYYPTLGPAGLFFLGYFGIMIAYSVFRFGHRLRQYPKKSLFGRRIRMTTLALAMICLASIDFAAVFGLPVYPCGYVAVLAFLAVVVTLERRHRLVYMTPAFAAEHILTTLHGAVLVVNPDGVVEMTNRASAELLGYAESELLESSMEQVFESQTEWRSIMHDSLAGKDIRNRETCWRRKHGEQFDVSLSASLLSDAKGRPLGVILAALDITERRRTEEALRLTQVSVDRAADLIHWIGSDGRILYASDSTCQRHGYSRDEMLKLTIFDLDPDQSPERWKEHWVKLKEQGSMAREVLHRTKDGELFPLELSITYVECGGQEYNFSFGRDISERRRTEASLEMTQFMLDHSQELVHWVGPEGRLIYVNDAFCRRLGYSRDELLGMTVNDIDPNAPRPWRSHFRELGDRRSLTFETVHRTKGGESFPVEVTVDYLAYKGGEYNCASSRDITERKLWEQALATERKHLSSLNAAAVEMSRCLTAADVQQVGIGLACTSTDCDGGIMWLFQLGARGRIIGNQGLAREGRSQLTGILRNSPAVERALSERTSVLLSETEVAGNGASGEPVFTTALAVPIASRGDAIGVVCLARGSNRPPLSEADLVLAEGIAALIGVSLENARLYDDAQYLAQRDPVTGLLNHRAINAELDRELARSKRAGSPLAMVMMDLDNFKLFNDTYGHACGDQVLLNVSDILTRSVRRKDIVGRYGGDEFVVLLPDTDAVGAMRTVERIRRALGEFGCRPDGDSLVPIFMSYGVAAYPRESSSGSELLAAADANLYRSKRQGGNRVTAPDTLGEYQEVGGGTFTVLDGLVTAVDGKDHYTRKHSDDVCEQAVALAVELGLSSEAQRCLRTAALLHDVGKIGIPDHILRKPGGLTEDEYEAVKQHVALGELIIKEIPDLIDVLSAVGSHHERYDGLGYPRGLQGDEIPLLGRVLAVTDAYSAMTTDRPYRRAFTLEEARTELKQVSGTQLDPRLVEAFLNVLGRAIGPRKERAVSRISAE